MDGGSNPSRGAVSCFSRNLCIAECATLTSGKCQPCDIEKDPARVNGADLGCGVDLDVTGDRNTWYTCAPNLFSLLAFSESLLLGP